MTKQAKNSFQRYVLSKTKDKLQVVYYMFVVLSKPSARRLQVFCFIHWCFFKEIMDLLENLCIFKERVMF